GEEALRPTVRVGVLRADPEAVSRTRRERSGRIDDLEAVFATEGGHLAVDRGEAPEVLRLVELREEDQSRRGAIGAEGFAELSQGCFGSFPARFSVLVEAAVIGAVVAQLHFPRLEETGGEEAGQGGVADEDVAGRDRIGLGIVDEKAEDQ